MKVMGLDVSLSSTGWVVLDQEAMGPFTTGVTVYGSQSFPKLSGVERLLAFADWLERELYLLMPDVAAVEDYGYAAMSPMAFAMGELGGVLKCVIERSPSQLHIVSISHWKKQLLGKGNLRKDEVRLEVFKRYGVEFKSQDTLDAYCVALSVWRELNGLDKPEPIKPKRARRVVVEKAPATTVREVQVT